MTLLHVNFMPAHFLSEWQQLEAPLGKLEGLTKNLLDWYAWTWNAYADFQQVY